MNFTTNFWVKSWKEVMKCGKRFVNHVKVEPCRVVAKVLQRTWSSPAKGYEGLEIQHMVFRVSNSVIGGQSRAFETF